ncbi:hypothetical protein RhiJN_12751 [Ceratobasidium sp. AG-Ba]|nr:hypothetical protein RhiJN_12751 [Ceratobasidium sp. AG-Ba]
MAGGRGRKRTSSSARPGSSPVKRRRASNNAADESTSPNQSGPSNWWGGVQMGVVAEDGSFFFPAASIPTENGDESCIKFVDVLPSELAAKKSGPKAHVSNDSGNRRVTRNSLKMLQAPSAPAASEPKPEQKTKNVRSKSQPKSQPKQPPKSTLTASASKPKKSTTIQDKLSMSSLPKPPSEPNLDDDPDEDEYDNYAEEDQIKSEASTKASEISFAVELDGAHETIRLPRNMDYDRFVIRMAILLDANINDMKLAFKHPGMKRSDLPLHLKNASHFDGMMSRVNHDIDSISDKLEALGDGGGKRVTDQRARLIHELESYTIIISDLAAQTKANAKGKQNEASKSKTNNHDVGASPHQRAYEFIKFKRAKCRICQEICGIVPIPGRGSTHVPLTEECIDLWARLSLQKSSVLYGPNPPEQVLSLLRTKILARSRADPDDTSNSQAANNQQLVVGSSNRALPETSLPLVNSGPLTLANPASVSASSLASSSTASQIMINPALFSGGGQVGGLGSSILPSIFAQLSQFPANGNQSPMVLFNIPQGFGLGGNSGIQLGSFGGFPVVQLGGGMFQGSPEETGRSG